jgi:hypothetical protein
VKYEVMQQEQTLASINKQITDDHEQIRVLNAEWTYLTRPERLQQMSDRFLHLQGMSSAQIVDLSAIPMRDNASAPLIADASAPVSAPPALAAAATAAPVTPSATATAAAIPGTKPARVAPAIEETRPDSSDELAARLMTPRIAAVTQKVAP